MLLLLCHACGDIPCFVVLVVMGFVVLRGVDEMYVFCMFYLLNCGDETPITGVDLLSTGPWCESCGAEKLRGSRSHCSQADPCSWKRFRRVCGAQ